MKCTTRTKNTKSHFQKLALLVVSFFKPSKRKNRVERGQGAVWHPITIREKKYVGGWAGTREHLVLTSQ